MKGGLHQLYRRRAKHFYYAFLFLLTLVFLASIVAYPFFKLPLPGKLRFYLNLLTLLSGSLFIPLSFLLKKRLFPILTEKDNYWSYTATKWYFWTFLMSGVPFFIAFLFYIIFAEVFTLMLGYVLSLMGLVLIKPKKEDIL